MTDKLKTYSVLIAWNGRDPEEGEYAAYVQAKDGQDAERLTRRLMWRDDEGREEGEKMPSDAKLADQYWHVLECQEGAIWKAQALEDCLRALVEPHYDESGVIDLGTASTIVGTDRHGRLQLKGSFLARLEAAHKLLAEIDNPVN